MFLCIIFWNAKIIYYSYVFKEAKLAKFIRFEAGWKLYIFYHKVLGDVVKRWRFWGLWGILENREVVSCEVVKSWSWNILLFEEILHYATLHSEWQGYVFYLRLGIWIIFETQRFLYYSYVFKEAKWEFASELMKRMYKFIYISRITNERDSLKFGIIETTQKDSCGCGVYSQNFKKTFWYFQIWKFVHIFVQIKVQKWL